jgi:multiple sugar transport system ATP-binding protein
MGQVTLEGVTKVFRDGTVALEDVSLAVPDGSFFVFVGPSGCGKTTLLRLIAGLEKPTEGKILIGGEDVTDDSPRDRDVAMVFQSYALYPHLTAFENMAFGLRSRRMGKKEVERQVQGAASLLGLEPVLHKRPRSLSGGQRQRVALGRAIVREPQVFLMDEPLSDVDTRLRDQMRGEIARIQRSLGVTTLYVTHDQAEAMTLGDQVAVMDEGLVRQIGTAKELYDRPADLFVATFLGTPPMNAVETVIEAGHGGPGVRFGTSRLPLDGGIERELAPGRKVVFGIRPEHIRPARPGDDRERLISLSSDRYELIGSQGMLRFQVDASPLMVGDPRAEVDPEGDLWEIERPNTFLARVESGHEVVPGVTLDLFVDVTRAHLFDPETELAIR